MNGGKDNDSVDLVWENRVLCSDESCIGTVDPDGRCRECGRRYEGTLPWKSGDGRADETAEGSPVAEKSAAEAQDSEKDEIPEPGDSSGAEKSDSSEDEWERRTLCPDESCIGVIGPDGRCKECGRSM